MADPGEWEIAVYRRCRQRAKGNTIVEMAFALPFFLLVVWGIFTIGMIYSHQLALNSAAREGARAAVVGHTDAEVIERINHVTPQLDHATAGRFGYLIDRTAERTVVTVEYTEKVVGIWPLTRLFNNKKLVARAEHKFESAWIPR